MKKIPHFTEKDRAKSLCVAFLFCCVIALISIVCYAPIGLIIPFALSLVLLLFVIKKKSREQYELERIKEKLNEKNHTDN